MGQVAIIYRCKIDLFPSHEEHSDASYKVDGQKKTDIHLKPLPCQIEAYIQLTSSGLSCLRVGLASFMSYELQKGKCLGKVATRSGGT